MSPEHQCDCSVVILPAVQDRSIIEGELSLKEKCLVTHGVFLHEKKCVAN